MRLNSPKTRGEGKGGEGRCKRGGERDSSEGVREGKGERDRKKGKDRHGWRERQRERWGLGGREADTEIGTGLEEER